MKGFVCLFWLYTVFISLFCQFSQGQQNPGENANKTLVTEKEPDSKNKRIVCYTSDWRATSPGPFKFDIDDVLPAMPLCTHIIYYYLKIDEDDNITSTYPERDLSQNGILARLSKAGRRFRHLKLMIGIGEFSHNDKYSKMIASPDKRRNLIKNAVNFLKEHDFDGIDMDWNYAGAGGNPPLDKINLIIFAKEIREEFDKHDFLISYFVTTSPNRISQELNVKRLSDYAHFINLYTYDYHGLWEQQVLPNAPLYGRGSTIESSIELFKELGAAPEKLNLGLTNFGSTYLLYEKIDKDYEKAVGKVAKDTGFHGPYYNLDGYIAYSELCLFLKDPAWKVIYDSDSNTKFAVNGDKVVSFEDGDTYYEKIMYALAENLGGVVYFGLEKDDYRNDCGFGKYPLLNKMKSTIEEYPKYLKLIKLIKENPADYFWNYDLTIKFGTAK